MTGVAANVERVCERVAAAAARAGRDVLDVRVIAVAKTQPASLVREAWDAGLRDIGENYVQEAVAKRAQLSDLPLIWHLIGPLQRNKAKRALEQFDVVHTVDRSALAQVLNRLANEAGRVLPVLLEVNVGGESTKSGVACAEAAALLEQMATLSNLVVDGLMTIPPPVDSAEEARPGFRKLFDLREALRRQAPPNAPLRELSMGMSDDFEVAIEEGATMVRIGRAIFGERAVPA